MLAEVGIGAVLKSPALAAKAYGDDAQVLPGRMGAHGVCGGATGVALVLNAELTGGVFLARRCLACCRDLPGILLWLGEVDGDLQRTPVRLRVPADVSCDGGAAHVAGIAAGAVEPVGRRLGPILLGKPLEAGLHLGGLGHEKAHHPHGDAVAAACGVCGAAVGHGDLGKRGEKLVGRLGRRPGRHGRGGRPLGEDPLLAGAGAGCPNRLEHGVCRPDAICPADEPMDGRVVHDSRCGVDERDVAR